MFKFQTKRLNEKIHNSTIDIVSLSSDKIKVMGSNFLELHTHNANSASIEIKRFSLQCQRVKELLYSKMEMGYNKHLTKQSWMTKE